jgi:hypothetical protein
MPMTMLPRTMFLKVDRVEFSKSTTQTRLMKLVTESSPMITAEAPDPTVTTKAAPLTKVINEASKEPGGNTIALEDIVTTLMVIPKNRKSTKKAPLKVQNNQVAQVQVTLSEVAVTVTDDDDAFTGRAFPINPDTIGPMSAAGAVNKPKIVEPGANTAQANMTSYEASKMARPGADPPEVAREGTEDEDDQESDNYCSSSKQRVVEPPDKLPMTTMASDKIHTFAEGDMTFKSLFSDPDSQPPEQFDKHGQEAEIINLHIRRIFVTDDFTDMMPRYHNVVESITESDDPPLNISSSKGDQGRQLEAPTERENSDDKHDAGLYDDHHQKLTLPNATYKSVAVGEQHHGVKAYLTMFDEAHKGESKLYYEADNDDVSRKSATEVTVMIYNTATLKSAHLLKATDNIDDEKEEPPEEHDAKTAKTMNATYKSIAVGEQNYGVKTCFIMFVTDDDNVSSKSATEVTVMMHNTAALKPTYLLNATANAVDEIEVPPDQHDDHDKRRRSRT